MVAGAAGKAEQCSLCMLRTKEGARENRLEVSEQRGGPGVVDGHGSLQAPTALCGRNDLPHPFREGRRVRGPQSSTVKRGGSHPLEGIPGSSWLT